MIPYLFICSIKRKVSMHLYIYINLKEFFVIRKLFIFLRLCLMKSWTSNDETNHTNCILMFVFSFCGE